MFRQHTTVTYDKNQWCAVPANNGGNGPTWQWGNELLVGFTSAPVKKTGTENHQVDNFGPFVSMLARSTDGGESWHTWHPTELHDRMAYTNDLISWHLNRTRENNVTSLQEQIDFTTPGCVLRVEGFGYHGNRGKQWYYSPNKGESWMGPYSFGKLLEHPELAGSVFTGRTAYEVMGPKECCLYLSVKGGAAEFTDKVFMARTTDGGLSFEFVSWVVPPSDPHRAVMPAPVRISETKLVAAIRRRDSISSCWIDCYVSEDNGLSWKFLSKVGDTGTHLNNGNPPAMIRLVDGRLCCVFGDRDRKLMLAHFSEDEGITWGKEHILRDDFKSVTGYADLGYPRLFQRLDGKLVTAYFWCSEDKPETHIEATIFTP